MTMSEKSGRISGDVTGDTKGSARLMLPKYFKGIVAISAAEGAGRAVRVKHPMTRRIRESPPNRICRAKDADRAGLGIPSFKPCSHLGVSMPPAEQP